MAPLGGSPPGGPPSGGSMKRDPPYSSENSPAGEDRAGLFVGPSVLQPITGAEDPPDKPQAQHEEAEDHRQADANADVRHTVKTPAEAADQVHHRVEQGDLLPQRRQHLDGVETAAEEG